MLVSCGGSEAVKRRSEGRCRRWRGDRGGGEDSGGRNAHGYPCSTNSYANSSPPSFTTAYWIPSAFLRTDTTEAAISGGKTTHSLFVSRKTRIPWATGLRGALVSASSALSFSESWGCVLVESEVGGGVGSEATLDASESSAEEEGKGKEGRDVLDSRMLAGDVEADEAVVETSEVEAIEDVEERVVDIEEESAVEMEVVSDNGTSLDVSLLTCKGKDALRRRRA